MIWFVVEILLFRNLCNGFRLGLTFEPGNQCRFQFRGRELCQGYNRKSIKISVSKFVLEMEPVVVPNVKR